MSIARIMAAVRSEAVQMDHWKTIVPIVPVHSAETEAVARSEPSEVLVAVKIAIAIAVDSEAVLLPIADHPMASPLVLLLQAAVRLVETEEAVRSAAEVAPIPAYAVHSAAEAAMVPVHLAAVLPAATAEATSAEEDRFNLWKFES